MPPTEEIAAHLLPRETTMVGADDFIIQKKQSDDSYKTSIITQKKALIHSTRVLRLSDYYPIADGITDDSIVLQAFLNDLTDNYVADFEDFDCYTGTQLNVPSNLKKVRIVGDEATLRSNGSILEIGEYDGLYQYTGLSINVDAYVPHFIVPDGVTLVAGDCIRLTVDITVPDTTWSTLYRRGLFAQVIKIVGGVAHLDVASEISFTAAVLRRFESFNSVSVSGLIFDNSSVTDYLKSAISLRVAGSAKICLEDNYFFGSPYALIGVACSGNNQTIRRNYIDNYQSLDTASRVGYGIGVGGNNIEIATNIIKDCKHNIAIGDRYQISQNINIDNNTMSQDPTTTNIVHSNVTGVDEARFWASFDFHGNVGNIKVNGNKILGSADNVFNIRSPKVTITNNTIRNLTGNYIFGSSEFVPSYIYLSGNDISSANAATLFQDNYGDAAVRLSASNKLTNVTTNIAMIG